MNVQEMIETLQKVDNKQAEVIIAHTGGEFRARVHDFDDKMLWSYAMDRSIVTSPDEPADEDWDGPDEGSEPAVIIWIESEDN